MFLIVKCEVFVLEIFLEGLYFVLGVGGKIIELGFFFFLKWKFCFFNLFLFVIFMWLSFLRFCFLFGCVIFINFVWFNVFMMLFFSFKSFFWLVFFIIWSCVCLSVFFKCFGNCFFCVFCLVVGFFCLWCFCW